MLHVCFSLYMYWGMSQAIIFWRPVSFSNILSTIFTVPCFPMFKIYSQWLSAFSTQLHSTQLHTTPLHTTTNNSTPLHSTLHNFTPLHTTPHNSTPHNSPQLHSTTHISLQSHSITHNSPQFHSTTHNWIQQLGLSPTCCIPLSTLLLSCQFLPL